MSPLERKKTEAELARVFAARMDMEVRLAELEEATTRIQKDVSIQLVKEEELKQKLQQ
jgi:polyribonucleotide nucleotidyltransferase